MLIFHKLNIQATCCFLKIDVSWEEIDWAGIGASSEQKLGSFAPLANYYTLCHPRTFLLQCRTLAQSSCFTLRLQSPEGVAKHISHLRRFSPIRLSVCSQFTCPNLARNQYLVIWSKQKVCWQCSKNNVKPRAIPRTKWWVCCPID